MIMLKQFQVWNGVHKKKLYSHRFPCEIPLMISGICAQKSVGVLQMFCQKTPDVSRCSVNSVENLHLF